MRRLFYIVWALITVSPGLLSAYDGAYLQLRQADGTPVQTDASHSWVPLLGFEKKVQTTVNIGSVSGGGTGRATAGAVMLQIQSNGVISEMFRGLALGNSYQVILHFVRMNEGAYASVMTELVFDQAFFSKIAAKAGEGDDAVIFDIEFQYGELRVIHTALDNRGQAVSPTAAGWDFTLNQAIVVSSVIPSLGDYTGSAPPPPNLDRDNDRMPNSWETQYNLDPDSSADAVLDPDADGFTNLQEYIAGTHPRQGNSFFRVQATLTAKTPVPRVELSWSAVAGRTYRVEATDDLKLGFSLIHTVIPTATGVQTHQPNSGKYFRVIVEE